MKLYHISIRHLKRHKIKTFLLFLGLVVPISTVVVLITISNVVSIELYKQLDEYGANILILPKMNSLSLSYGGMNISAVEYERSELRESDLQKIFTIKNNENISVVSPKLFGAVKFFKLSNSGDTNFAQNLTVSGVNFDNEFKLKKWWKLLGRKPARDDEVIIGFEVARYLNLSLGDKISLNGELFQVVGILDETGSQDDIMIFADLKRVQELLGKPGSVTLAEISALCYNCPIEEIVRQISEVLPKVKVTAIKQLIESRMETMHRVEKFSFGISSVMILISALVVFTSISYSVNERTKEIGIFRAIGYKRSHIMKVILTEVFIVSFFSGLIGYFVGYVVSIFLAPVLFGVEDAFVKVNLFLLVSAISLSVLVGTGAGIYPAYKASRLDPAVALRSL